jgi:hypothetical protein
MRILQLVLLFAAFFSLLCAGQESCPWLNAATAGGVLGGAVSAAITHSGKNRADITCDFVRKESVEGELRIEVETMSEPKTQFASLAAQCGPTRTPLKAIGNEAAVCTLDAKNGRRSEQVIGRVRDQAFIICITTNDRAATQSSVREKARSVAEQVAGTLF